MIGSRSPSHVITTLVVSSALVLGLAGCVGNSPSSTSSHAGGSLLGSKLPPIRVGSFDFPESVLLASIYQQTLSAHGYPARRMVNIGTRELVDPALMNGLVELVPEYSGSALEFASLGRSPATSRVRVTHRMLGAALSARGLVALAPALAQDANALVVTKQMASRYHLRSVSDLARVAPRLVFGGPPECPERPLCLPGLRHTYGLHFKQFVSLDTGGPLTVQALVAGQIDVALLFTTDPTLLTAHLVVLTDDKGLQPAENVTPVMRQATLNFYGARLKRVIDSTSAKLSTKVLRRLDASVTVRGEAPERVASSWLRSQGLI